MGKEKTTFHLIRSVKGGSGKTAFALHKTMELAVEMYDKNEKNLDMAKVLYIDADVHATQTLDMLAKSIAQYYTPKVDVNRYFRSFVFTNDIADSYRKMETERCCCSAIGTLNSFMHPYRGAYSEIESIIQRADIKEYFINVDEIDTKSGGNTISTDGEMKGHADFIFADCTKMGLAVFDSFYQMNGKTVLGIGAYIARIRDLLCYAVHKGYKDVIIDMPPGSDPFSSHLAEVLVRFTSEENDECNLNVYYVSGPDVHHLSASKNAIIEHMHTMKNVSAQKLIFVFNIGREPEYANSIGEITAEKVNESIEIIDALDIFELSRIEFQVFGHDQLYYNCAVFGLGRNSSPMFEVAVDGRKFIKTIKYVEGE